MVGVVGIMVLGFAWWGWVLGSTAERMAKARAEGAVTALLVPICVERVMGQADAATKLVECQNTASWQQSQLIEKGGWATLTATKTRNGGGTDVRPTAREPQRLTCSPEQKEGTQKPRHVYTFAGLVNVWTSHQERWSGGIGHPYIRTPGFTQALGSSRPLHPVYPPSRSAKKLPGEPPGSRARQPGSRLTPAAIPRARSQAVISAMLQ